MKGGDFFSAPINGQYLLCHHLISGDFKETFGDSIDTVSI